MPKFDLRNIKVAKYVNNNGTISYSDRQKAGDAMSAVLSMRFAEGRLYAESALAEYMRKCVGGSITLGVKYIPDAAQQLLFGSTEKSRSVSYTIGSESTTKAVKSLELGANSVGSYVGIAFYAPDMIDGVQKFTAIFLPKVLFGPFDYNLKTADENFTFDTPVSTGEFLASNAADKTMIDVAVCDNEAEAKAWVDDVLGSA